jgi:hypothetical protein
LTMPSGAPGGPRAGGLDGDRLDSHKNLILLCREHHKQIDDQFKHYTVERLHQEDYSKSHVIEKKNSPRAASYASQ